MNLDVYGGVVGGFILGYLIPFCFKKKSAPVVDKVKDYCKFVMVFRTDKEFDKGKTAEYCVKATVECYKNAVKQTPHYVKKWQKNSQPKIVLKLQENVSTSVKELQSKAERLGIVTVAVSENGPSKDSFVVLGVGPGPEDLINEITGHLKLL